MNKAIAIGVGLLLLILLILFSTTYTVKYNEVVVKATFGQTGEENIVKEPGAHYRLPIFIDKVHKLDTRLQLVESPLEEIATRDGLQLVSRAYLLWRVDTEGRGPLNFFERYGSIEEAAQLMRGQFRTAFTGVLGKHEFRSLIGENSTLDEAEEDIRLAMAETLSGQGVVPVSVGISQLMFPPKTSRVVLERMMAYRDVLANSEETKGTAEAARIRAEATTKADKIIAFASRRAEEIRAMGQEQEAEFLKTMSQDEELAVFLFWKSALEQALSRYTTFVIPGSIAPFHLMAPGMALKNGKVPMPADGGFVDAPGGLEAAAAPVATEPIGEAEQSQETLTVDRDAVEGEAPDG
jgi:membrane protease subunit HflC